MAAAANTALKGQSSMRGADAVESGRTVKGTARRSRGSGEQGESDCRNGERKNGPRIHVVRSLFPLRLCALSGGGTGKLTKP